jgi:L-threonylcarbamoyladenylate synthase
MRLAFSLPLTASLSRAQMPRPPSSPLTLATRSWRGNSDDDLRAAAAALAAGKLVAFPTETVYGLGADARNSDAVRAVFAAKGRPQDNPLIVHLASAAALAQARLTPVPLLPVAAAVTGAFWPGPLTVVLPCIPGASVSRLVTAGLDSVAIRVPRHPVALALLEAAGVPVAAPSANCSGRPSPTEAAHVFADLRGRIDGVVDGSWDGGGEGGASDFELCGLESTVVDLTDESRPTILRPGAISASALERVAGVAFRTHAPTTTRGLTTAGTPTDGDSPRQAGEGSTACDGATATPRAPGMKYRHYAPRAPVILCAPDGAAAEVQKQLELHGRSRGPSRPTVGLLADAETCDEVRGKLTELPAAAGGVACVACGARGDVASVARALYSSLRAFDGEGERAVPAPGVAVIVAVALPDAEDGIAAAVMNRLRKAASAPLRDRRDGKASVRAL